MSSSIPFVIDALVRIAGDVAAADVVPNLQVIDGQPLSVEDNYLAVGFTREPESYAVEIEEDFQDLGHSSSVEEYHVECEASTWTGDSDQKVTRDLTFALLDAFKQAVNDDTEIREVADEISVKRGGLIQGVAGQGAVCTVPFAFFVRAYIQP